MGSLGCCERQRATAGSLEEVVEEVVEGDVRETWPRIFLGVGEGRLGESLVSPLVAMVVEAVSVSSATHASSVEGDERNSMA